MTKTLLSSAWRKVAMLVALGCWLGLAPADAKDQVTTLWEGNYTDNIAIPVAKLQTGGTVTVHVTAYEGGSLHLFYIQNNSGWTQKAFDENGGTIGQWPWVNKGDASYQFTIAAADMDILNDDTEETGSRGHLMIGTVDAAKVAINKITLTTSGEDEEGDATTVWSGSHDLAGWNGLALTGTAEHNVLKGAKKGDVIRITYTADEAGQINVCYGNWTGIEGGHYEVAVIDEPATIDFEIVTAAILEQVQNGGIVLNGTNALLSKVELLTFDSSYDAVPLTIGESGIATWSSMKKCDFTGTGLTAYYVSEVAAGSVKLKQTDTTWDWCGYVVVGDAGTYDIPVTDEASYPSATYLKAQVVEGTVVASAADKYHYVLAAKMADNCALGFYRLTADQAMAAHKAYLETDTDIASADVHHVSIVFDGEATGVSDMLMENSSHAAAPAYDLQGRRVSLFSKGIYIINGKKIVK
jgi:hypothetical protein